MTCFGNCSDLNVSSRNLEQKMSILWKHFVYEGNEKASCSHCNVLVSFKNGNRSIMRKHLERKHPETLGITTQSMVDSPTKSTDNEHPDNIHSLFEIESNIKYFIQMIYERPTLYEFSRQIGWNSKQNKAVWQEISDVFQVQTLDCQKFWKYLKETYDLHRRNPKLDDHKYARELSFLGDLYKKKRQRKDLKAKERKFLKSLNITESSENMIFDENIQFDYEQSQDGENSQTVQIIQEEIIVEGKQDRDQLQQQYTIFGDYDDINKEQITYMDSDHQYTEETKVFDNSENLIVFQNDTIVKTNDEDDDDGIVNYDTNIKYSTKAVLIETKNENEQQQQLPTNERNFANENDLVNKTNLIENHLLNENNHLINVNYLPPTKCKKCSGELDELDLLMEYVKKKLRRFPTKEMNKLQLKILQTVMDAEQNKRSINSMGLFTMQNKISET